MPAGTAPVTLTAATPAATFAAIAPVVAIGGVSINSPPMVTFSVADASNNAILGLGSKSQTTTAVAASYPNLVFSLAKLVPAANGAPSRWVNYIITTMPTYKSATDKTIVPGTVTRPTTDNTGTLTDYGNGIYTYQFYRDITTIKDQVTALKASGDAVAKTLSDADIADLAYDKTAIHRVTIQISGSAPGTGTNQPDGVQKVTTDNVVMANPVNMVYDFIPAAGRAVAASDTQREIVATAKCNDCHYKLGGAPNKDSVKGGFHGSGRYDTRYCVVCHTDQQKYGQTNVTSTAGSFPALTTAANASTTSRPNPNAFGSTAYSTTPTTIVADGEVLGNFPILIHKIHRGEDLYKKNYNFANVLFNEVKFPRDAKDCTKCHGVTGAANATAQGDNYKNVPNRKACGACHDGINFDTGKGVTNADARLLLTTSTLGHVGGIQLDDSKCVLCHAAADIPVYHPSFYQVLSTTAGTMGAQYAGLQNPPTGVPTLAYEIKSVAVSGTPKRATVVFRMLKNGSAVTFNTYAAGAAMLTGFSNGSTASTTPRIYIGYAVPQDNITSPADFNVNASVYLQNLWDSTKGTLSAPDSSGYYTAVLGKATTDGMDIPTSAVMVTAFMGYNYWVPTTGVDLVKYPAIRLQGQDVQMVATGYTARRTIVSNAKCNVCHEQLGIDPNFHSGSRNDATACALCHNPNAMNGGWSYDSKTFIHAIHAANPTPGAAQTGKRANAYTFAASSATDNFGGVRFPGYIQKCETCHVSGTYDLSASNYTDTLFASMQPVTVARGALVDTVGYTLNNKVSTTTGTTGTCDVNSATSGSASSAYAYSPYITKSTSAAVVDYGNGFSYNTGSATVSNGCKPNSGGVAVSALLGAYTFYSVAAGSSIDAQGTTLVNSPVASACFSCHDSAKAKAHMSNDGGGSIYRDRTTALTKTETCTFCHGSTGTVPIKTRHGL
ncbi:MAG: OmcA/MtrC family decaheme c-type cytochrome [Proteobacteria bacterium]|nr:OmcA/MtrC family decaheme c-type cytochrome [Pseudomonadota bacterium]